MILVFDIWTPTPCGDTICPTITYDFENGQITTAGADTFLEFDIYAMQNEPSLKYAGGDVIFTYSNSVFGTNIVDSGGITVTSAGITEDTNAYSLSLTDTLFQSNILPSNGSEVFLSIRPRNSDSLIALADTLQQLCHIKMKRKHTGDLEVMFDQFYMENESEYYTYDYLQYSQVNTLSPLRATSNLYFNLIYVTANINSTPITATFNIVAYATVNSSPIANAQIYFNYDPTVVSIAGVFFPTALWYPTYASDGDNIYAPNYTDNGSGNLNIYVNTNPDTIYDPTDPNVSRYPSSTGLFATVNLNVIQCNENPQLSLGANGGILNNYGYLDGSGGYSLSDYNVIINGSYTSSLCLCSGKDEDSNCTGIISITDKPIWSVYPNPFTNGITITLNLFENANIVIDVVDILGQRVYNKFLGKLSGKVEQIIQMPEGISSGIYFVRLDINGNEYSTKIIKE